MLISFPASIMDEMSYVCCSLLSAVMFWECLVIHCNCYSLLRVCESNLMVTGMIGLGLVTISSVPGSMMIVDDLSLD